VSWGFRKSFGLGRLFRVNLSKKGASLTSKAGPVSTNSRTRRIRHWAFRNLVAVEQDALGVWLTAP
jgi:hypothetical protein